jgi:mono/diheme cytochrome c family protein
MKIAGLLLLLFTIPLLTQSKNFPSAFVHVPAKAHANTSPLVTDPASVAVGQKLFADKCGVCHGTLGEGTSRAPGLISNDDIKHATPGDVFWVITNGVIRRGMPPWAKLPEPQRWQIVAYVMSVNVAASQQ